MRAVRMRVVLPVVVAVVLGVLGIYWAWWGAPPEQVSEPAPEPAEESKPISSTAGVQRQSLARDGVAITFEARPLNPEGELIEGNQAELRFTIRDAASGQAIAGLSPGAWLDQAQALGARDGRQMDCRARIGIYLKGVMGARPLLDLNSYFLLVLNKDPSITVIDPSVSVGGITSTYSRIPLKRSPMDWVASRRDKRVYVSLPEAGEVAVIDTDSFAVSAYVPAGKSPVRVALQPDGRYLWVGDNAGGGVSVIDTETLKPVASLPSGRGHHEIAFSGDSRHAFVSNRDSGTVSVFDVASLEHLRDIETGPHPLSLAYSALAQAIYVSDGESGSISVIDAQDLNLRKVIQSRPGLGPVRFTQDGRFGLALNTLEDRTLVIDTGSDRVIHELEVSPEPYQLVLTRAYAYVRGLASPKVTMINLASLGDSKKPIVQAFEAGPAAPKLAGDLPLADSLVQGRDDNAVFVVNPVDNTSYFYMEGMNAPMSGYLNRGHTSRAAMVVDRSLREVEKGVFSAKVTLPAPGEFDVAMMLNQPELTHCFSATVKSNPDLAKSRETAQVQFIQQATRVRVGQPALTRFRILRGVDGKPWSGVADLRVRYFLAPSSRPLEVSAHEVSEGVYEAALELHQAGAWYLHVRSPSLGLDGAERAYSSLRVVPESKDKQSL